VDFSQFVEYVTTDGVHHVAPQQHELDNPLVLDTVRGGYERAAQLGRAWTLAAGELDALKEAAPYHADVVAHEMVSDSPLEIVERLAWVRDRPMWRWNAEPVAGEVWLYEGNLYRCNQSHRIDDPGWTPDATPALWSRYYTPTETPAWVAPTGAQDAWPLDAQVTHNGHLWTSLIRDNVWEPGSAGAEALWRCEDCEPVTDAWAVGVAYTGDNTAGQGNGDLVTYNGRLYRCWQSHTSITGWQPPNVPALWIDLGPV